MRALKRVQGDAAKLLRRELRDIADDVKMDAQANVTHKTGRHGGPNVPHLGPSIKSSTTGTGASIYSDAPHAIVQDVGGQVGRDRSALLKRADVSHYMSKAVEDARPYVNRRLEELLDEFGREFEK